MKNKKLLSAVPFIVGISYCLMWFILASTTRKLYYADEYYPIVSIIKYNISYILLGILLFAFPYEKIIANISFGVEWFGSFLGVSEKTKGYLKVITGMIIYCCCYFLTNDNGKLSYRKYLYGDLLALFFSYYAIFLILQVGKQIKNVYMAASLSVLITFVNTYVSFEIAQRFALSAIVFSVCIFVYCINNKYENIKHVLLTIILVITAILEDISLAQRWEYFQAFFDGEGFITAGSIIESFNNNSTMPDLCRYVSYNITEIICGIGVWAAIAYFLLFIVITASVIYKIAAFSTKSKKRSLMALALYLIWFGSFIYGVCMEIGILPVSSIYCFYNRLNLPMFFLFFRMFEIRKVNIKNVPTFEQLHMKNCYDELADIQEELMILQEKRRREDVISSVKLMAKIDIIAEHLSQIEEKVGGLESKDDSGNITIRNLQREISEVEIEIDDHADKIFTKNSLVQKE